MLKAIWMSDLHYVAQGDVLGHDPRARLASVIEHINTHFAASDFCIVSGDMVNRESVEDYAAVSKKLKQLHMQCFPMMGNHDDRVLLKQAFILPDNCMPNFVQFSLSTCDGEVICLDTKKVDSDEGEFCSERLAWLSDRLDALGETPAYIFMHHPPMKLGLPMQDTENLVESDALLELFAEHTNVKYLFIGHVHRPIVGTIRGIPFATMRSVLYQAPAPLPAWDWQSFKPGNEAPSIGALTIDHSDVTLQYIQFCQYEDGLV